MGGLLPHFPGRMWGILAAAWLLAACDESAWTREDLAGKAQGPVSGPDCAACHAYPPRDTNHVYHLFETGGRHRQQPPHHLPALP